MKTLRSNRVFRSAALILSGLGGGVLALLWGRALLRVDPFAHYRASQDPGQDIGIELQDVRMVDYDGQKLAASWRAAKIAVRQDRREITATRITDGFFPSDRGTVHFEAETAQYVAAGSRVNASLGAHVWSKDFNLKSPTLEILQNTGQLRSPGPITGRLFDGDVQASNLIYILKSGAFSAGPMEWVGVAAIGLQGDSEQPKRTKWTIKSPGLMTHNGHTDTWQDAQATDGDVLVHADKVVRDSTTDVLTATGHVGYFSDSTNMVCEKAVIYRREKRAVLTGHVNVLFKPEDSKTETLKVEELPPFRPMVPDAIAAERPPAPASGVAKSQQDLDQELHDAATRRKYPTTAVADQVEYWYAKGNRHATITGDLQANQDLPGGRWRHIWASIGHYDGEKKTLKLQSQSSSRLTRVKTSIGDDMTCDWLMVSTKEGDDSYQAQGAQGDFMSDEDIPKEEETKKKPPQSPQKPGPLKGPIPANPPGGNR